MHDLIAQHDYNDSCCEKHGTEKANDKQQLWIQYVGSWGRRLLQMHEKINGLKAGRYGFYLTNLFCLPSAKIQQKWSEKRTGMSEAKHIKI